MKFLNSLFLLLLCCSSCYYDNEEELYPNGSCETEAMSYAADILPIIENRCLDCHNAASNFGSVTLEGYEQVKTYVENGFLQGVIKWESNFSNMPQNEPQMPQCEIDQIDAWITQGYLNN